jgi:hypothetical protein
MSASATQMAKEKEMSQKFSRDQLVASMVRAGELEVSGDAPDELAGYFAPGYRFHGPGGFESDLPGLLDYFASVRAAFDDRSIRRGVVIVEGIRLDNYAVLAQLGYEKT